MILFLFLNLLNYCLLIIPEKIQANSLSDTGDSHNNCPCDLTYQTCDRNCECDNFCSEIDGGYDANNEYRKPGSHPFENKYETLLPMCSDLDKSTITDLYNPLSIGYQILKRGLCLFKDTVNNDDSIHYENTLDKINEQLELDNVKDDSDSENNGTPKEIDDSSSSYEIYDNLEINFPIMLPDGSCLKKATYIKFLQDKKVICLDKIDKKDINDLISNFDNIFYYSLENNIFLKKEEQLENKIKKILIEFYSDNIHISSKKLTVIYDKNIKDEYYEVIYEVKFYSNISLDLTIKSGNPGIVKGKPIITEFLGNRIFSGVDSDGKCIEIDDSKNNTSNIYYEDDIIKNTFTFEDNIIYGCNYKNNNDNNKFYIYENIIQSILNKKKDEINNEEQKLKLNKYSIASLGNPYFKKDLTLTYNYDCNGANNNIISLDILYEAIGNKNNTQNKILFVKCYSDYNKLNVGNKKYIKINFYKVKSESEWWHAPGWKWFWPKNIMYPFRIGTTQYKEKN